MKKYRALTIDTVSTIIAALRLAQRDMQRLASMPHFDDDIKCLTDDEIDAVCEALNCRKVAWMVDES